jgi:hypothetical protein
MTYSSAFNNRRCLTVLTASEQKIFGASWADGTRLSGLPTVRSVSNATIKQVHELDDKTSLYDKARLLHADHWAHYRGKEDLVLGPTFPVHALISVESIETADDVADYLNKVFNLDRGKYPKKDGWQAMAAHSGASVPLDNNHPFFRFKETGILDSRCCRFLVVNEMAVEGLNNRYLTVWGAAETFGSRRKGTQRVGRFLRSAAVRDGRTIRVPPASHDRIYIITHEAFESAQSIKAARISTARTISESIDFILDMHQATADMMSLDEYVELEVADAHPGELDRVAELSRWTRCAIAMQIGQALREGRRPQVRRIVRMHGGTGEYKKHYVRAFAESALNHRPSRRPIIVNGVRSEREVDAIEDLKQRILRTTPPQAEQVLEAERLAIKVLDQAGAIAWLERYEWGHFWVGLCSQGNEKEWTKTVNGMYISWEGQFDKYELDVRQTPAARLVAMAEEITRNLDLEEAGAKRVSELVLEGALHYLPGLRPLFLAQLDEGGPFCRPEITYALRSERFVSQLQGWVCFMLLKEGHLDDLWAVLRFVPFWESGESSGPT